MNLDDLDHIRKLDRSGMLASIRSLPDQLEEGWRAGSQFSLPEFKGFRNVLIAGMGRSAIGADLLSHYVAPYCSVPVLVYRDYDLPAWARGPETLVIASSYSGNTEETVSAYLAARQSGCTTLCICTNGRLEELSHQNTNPVWIIRPSDLSQAQVGFTFGLLMAALFRCGLIPDPTSEIEEAVRVMGEQQKKLEPEIQAARNPAKRMAGQLFGRWVSVLGSGYMAPVARRWKSQINALAKAWAQFEFIPEADHNTLAGVVNPVDVITRTLTIFLRAPSDHPRNSLRTVLTQEGFMIAGLNTDFFDAGGAAPLAHIFSAVQFGDFMAFYLAIAYGVDPTPLEAVDALKAALAS